MKHLPAALALAVPLMAAAPAPSIPRYDVDRGCQIASHGMASGFNLCRRNEQDAYDAAKSVWPRLPGWARAKCVALTNAPTSSLWSDLNVNGYQRLWECIVYIAPAVGASSSEPFQP